MNLEKVCATCFYNKGGKCEILKSQIDNCSAWADEAEAKRREEAIVQYSGLRGNENVPPTKSLTEERIKRRTATRLANKEKRKGRTIAEILDESFHDFYMHGLDDIEIGKKLDIDSRRVADYRNRYSLPMIKKNRPAPTGTAV